MSMSNDTCNCYLGAVNFVLGANHRADQREDDNYDVDIAAAASDNDEDARYPSSYTA